MVGLYRGRRRAVARANVEIVEMCGLAAATGETPERIVRRWLFSWWTSQPRGPR
jgi:hypothetical protein